MWQSVGQKDPSSPLLELNTGSKSRRKNILKNRGFLERVCATSL